MADEEAVRVFAPAKVNLALHVTGQREDGYHTIDTVCAFAAIGDIITVSDCRRDDHSFTGPRAGLLDTGPENLVVRARDALRSKFGKRHCGPVAIEVEKNLPVAAGLGGGSADAAATMLALIQLWDLPLDPSDSALQDMALSLGADVPMCLISTPLIASGIGDVLQPVAEFPTLNIVIVNSGEQVATSQIFSDLAEKRNPPLPPLPHSLDTAGIVDWLSRTRNDLQPPAMKYAPSICEALSALDSQSPLFLRMSGSGASCFGLFPSMEEARSAARAIAGRRPEWYVEAAQTTTER